MIGILLVTALLEAVLFAAAATRKDGLSSVVFG